MGIINTPEAWAWAKERENLKFHKRPMDLGVFHRTNLTHATVVDPPRKLQVIPPHPKPEFDVPSRTYFEVANKPQRPAPAFRPNHQAHGPVYSVSFYGQRMFDVRGSRDHAEGEARRYGGDNPFVLTEVGV